MSKHTPGQWTYSPEEDGLVACITGPRGQFVAEFFDGLQEANARLIAAAPEMYEALAALCEVLTGECRLDHDGYCQEHFLDRVADGCRVDNARAVLAKVEANQ